MQIKEQNFSKLSKIFKYLLLENIDSEAAFSTKVANKTEQTNKTNTFLSKESVFCTKKLHIPKILRTFAGENLSSYDSTRK